MKVSSILAVAVVALVGSDAHSNAASDPPLEASAAGWFEGTLNDGDRWMVICGGERLDGMIVSWRTTSDRGERSEMWATHGYGEGGGARLRVLDADAGVPSDLSPGNFTGAIPNGGVMFGDGTARIAWAVWARQGQCSFTLNGEPAEYRVFPPGGAIAVRAGSLATAALAQAYSAEAVVAGTYSYNTDGRLSVLFRMGAGSIGWTDPSGESQSAAGVMSPTLANAWSDQTGTWSFDLLAGASVSEMRLWLLDVPAS